MPVTDLFTLYGVKAGATLIGGIKSQNVRPGIKIDTPIASGLPRAAFQAITEAKPVVEFSTEAIAAALTVLTAVGVKISGLSGGLILYGQYMDKGATRKTGTAHVSYTAVDGLLVPVRLSCTHRQYATLSASATLTYDGINAPIVPATGVALPAGITDAERFGLGGAKIGNVTIPQLTSMDIDFGLNVVATGSDSEVYDTHCYIQNIQPKVTLKGTAPTWFSSSVVPLTGKAGTQANTTFYLRKYSNGGSFVDGSLAQHIKIVAAGLAVITAVDAGGEGAADVTIEMPMTWDLTNECLVLNTASAIT